MSTKKAEFFEFHFLLLVPSGSTPLKRPSRLWPQFHPSHLIRFSTSAHSLFLDWLHWPKSGTGEKVIWGCASRPDGRPALFGEKFIAESIGGAVKVFSWRSSNQSIVHPRPSAARLIFQLGFPLRNRPSFLLSYRRRRHL